jgi:hypothetical protein
MTEEQWLSCTDPTPMLEFLHGKASGRRFHLLACACCREIWPLLGDDRSRAAVEVSEAFADGRASEHELEATWAAASAAAQAAGTEAERLAASAARASTGAWAAAPAEWAASLAAGAQTRGPAAGSAGEQARTVLYATERRQQARLVRCIFDNPFRSVEVASAWLAWRAGAAPKLAQAIYEERSLPSGHLDAARLAVLADMLEEAGATDAQLLTHLRSAGPHVRGCVAVDAILGRG